MEAPSPARSFPSARRGFRFAQFFVLFAIVALGIAYLIPVIQRVREQSNLARCKDNLRKAGASLLLYAHANGSDLPVSPTVENPHLELTTSLMASQSKADPGDFYCPSLRDPAVTFSEQHFKAGIIGYYYYGAMAASTDPGLSRFLRGGVTWPRKLNTSMDGKTWVMSDIWMSGLETAHPGFRKGVNYLMLDGSVDFVGESPRQQFH
jgi:prepilin-type processing-associated H-X9-DG protein